MKIVISSLSLYRKLETIQNLSSPILNWRIISNGIQFLPEDGDMLFLSCDTSLYKDINKRYMNVWFPFKKQRWDNVSGALIYLPEQPLSLEFDSQNDVLKMVQCTLTFDDMTNL